MNRRNFVKNSLKASAATTMAVTGFPTIVPASVIGKNVDFCIQKSSGKYVWLLGDDDLL
jgi:hypothetical protein